MRKEDEQTVTGAYKAALKDYKDGNKFSCLWNLDTLSERISYGSDTPIRMYVREQMMELIQGKGFVIFGEKGIDLLDDPVHGLEHVVVSGEGSIEERESWMALGYLAGFFEKDKIDLKKAEELGEMGFVRLATELCNYQRGEDYLNS